MFDVLQSWNAEGDTTAETKSKTYNENLHVNVR